MAAKTNNYGSIVSLLPSFEGNEDEDVEYFISQFDAICNLAKLDKNAKLVLLRNKLKGAALQYLMQNEHIQKIQDYDIFKTTLSQRFQKDQNIFEAQENFMSTEQKPNENVKQFKDRIDTLATKFLSATQLQNNNGAVQFNEKLKLSKFLDGLRPEIKLDTKKRGPQNFQEAFEIAKTVEMAVNGSEATINNVSQDTSIFDLIWQSQREQEIKLQQLTKKIEELSSANTHQEEQQITCQICFKPRHTARQCWYNVNNAGMQLSAQGTHPQAHLRPRIFNAPQNRVRTGQPGFNTRAVRPRNPLRQHRPYGRHRPPLNN